MAREVLGRIVIAGDWNCLDRDEIRTLSGQRPLQGEPSATRAYLPLYCRTNRLTSGQWPATIVTWRTGQQHRRRTTSGSASPSARPIVAWDSGPRTQVPWLRAWPSSRRTDDDDDGRA